MNPILFSQHSHQFIPDSTTYQPALLWGVERNWNTWKKLVCEQGKCTNSHSQHHRSRLNLDHWSHEIQWLCRCAPIQAWNLDKLCNPCYEIDKRGLRVWLALIKRQFESQYWFWWDQSWGWNQHQSNINNVGCNVKLWEARMFLCFPHWWALT